MLIDRPLRLGEEGWYAVAKATELSTTTMLKRWLFDRPLILFGTETEPVAMYDRCPHRSAPLSHGRLVDGMVECPFHGWRFDTAGQCRLMPCLPGEPPMRRAHVLEAVVRHGLVFVRMGKGAAEPPPPVLHDANGYRYLWSGLEVKGALAAIAENFLDATHTITVHPGILRGTTPRTATTVIVDTEPGSVSVTYQGEGKPAGLAARLFEGARSAAIGRFRGPNVTDVEFHGPKGPRIAITSYLTPTQNGKTSGFAVVTVPGARWLGWLKFRALKPLAALVNRQDMRILDLVDDNHARFGRPPRAKSPTDYVMTEIEAILDGQMPLAQARREIPAFL